jgi:Cyclic nucleotide-binding domain
MADTPDTTPQQAASRGPDELLATKLHLPRPPRGFVARPRLVDRLDDGLARELTLISASAGFGKTSLLADWSQRGERRVGWLSLDAGDNDPVRFWRHAIAALALERELSLTIMRGGTRPAITKLRPGKTLVAQGDRGDQIFVLLDGVVSVEVDGKPVAEIGPGAVLGERALLEGGVRTSTVRAATACKVAAATGDQLDRAALAELSTGHRREEQVPANER